MRRAAGRTRINVTVDDVRRHNSVQLVIGNQRAENRHIFSSNVCFRARIARGFFMGIRRHRPVAREMFAGGFHARIVHTVNEARRHCQRDTWIVMIRTLTNCRANVSYVQHRGEADIDIHGDHLAGHQPACVLRQLTALFSTQQRSKRLCGG